jgi:selenide,water dikinase
MYSCGGCRGKLGGTFLAEMLAAGWAGGMQDKVPPFVTQPEDSALIDNHSDPLLFSTDMIPLPGVSLFDAGRIGALHALSDIYASGGLPRWALVTLLLDRSRPLEHGTAVMQGVLDACRQDEVSILGGHTVVGAEAMVGLSVIGLAKIPPLRKTGARPGHRLLLSKPIGTGLCLAGFKHGLCEDDVLNEAMGVRLTSNRDAGFRVIQAHASSCTDVTGFGLLGHLAELLPPDMGAELAERSIPTLRFAAEAPRPLAESAWIRSNYEYASSRLNVRCSKHTHEIASMLDPQTNGPLLATAAAVDAERLALAGFAEIGQVTERPGVVIQ